MELLLSLRQGRRTVDDKNRHYTPPDIIAPYTHDDFTSSHRIALLESDEDSDGLKLAIRGVAGGMHRDYSEM